MLFKVIECEVDGSYGEAEEYVEVSGVEETPTGIRNFVQEFGGALRSAGEKDTAEDRDTDEMVSDAIDLYQTEHPGVEIKMANAPFMATIYF